MNPPGNLVPKAIVCRVLRVRPQRYTYWARTGVLDTCSTGLTLAQAVQLAVLVALLKSDISLQALRTDWDDVKSQLDSLLPVGDVYVVWDSDTFAARVVTGKRALARAIIGVPRPQVIPLRSWLSAATTAFGRGLPRRWRSTKLVVSPPKTSTQN
jgi:hypothetical protein